MNTKAAELSETKLAVPPDDRLAHLVLKADWPIALCGATVSEFLGAGAPGRDRCPKCLRITQTEALGRPAWTSPERTE